MKMRPLSFRRKLALFLLGLMAASARAAVPSVYVVEDESRSLGSISKELFGDAKYWKKIAGWNQLAPPYKIKKGQQLVIHEIPKKARSSMPTSLPGDVKGSFQAPVARELKAKTYTVNERAPSLSMIALELYGDETYKRGLIRENKLAPPYALKLGQKLKLPLAPKRSADEGTSALIREWQRLGNIEMVVRLKATLSPEASQLADGAPGIVTEKPGAAEDSEESLGSSDQKNEVHLALLPPPPPAAIPEATPPPAAPTKVIPITEKTIAATPDSPHSLVTYPQAVATDPAADPTPRARDVSLELALTFETLRADGVDNLTQAEGLFLTNVIPGAQVRILPSLNDRDRLVFEGSLRQVSFRDNSQGVPFLGRQHTQVSLGGGMSRAFPGLDVEGLLQYRSELFAHGIANQNQVEMVSVGVMQLAARASGNIWQGERQQVLGLFGLSLLAPANSGGVKASAGYKLSAGLRWKRQWESSTFLTEFRYSSTHQNAGYQKQEQTVGLLLGLEWSAL